MTNFLIECWTLMFPQDTSYSVRHMDSVRSILRSSSGMLISDLLAASPAERSLLDKHITFTIQLNYSSHS